jgi:hypothetical protein
MMAGGVPSITGGGKHDGSMSMFQTIESDNHRRIFLSLLAQRPQTRDQPPSSILDRSARSIDGLGICNVALRRRAFQKTPPNAGQNRYMPAHGRNGQGRKKDRLSPPFFISPGRLSRRILSLASSANRCVRPSCQFAQSAIIEV